MSSVKGITPERWLLIEPILDRALELEGEERAALLDQSCGEDPVLRGQIEALLASDARASGFLSSPIGEQASTLLGSLGREQGSARAEAPSSSGGRLLPGAVLGDRYRIVEWLGRGGMGEVYRADDLKLGQSVALKFVAQGGEHDEAALERLANEVRMALKVSHPNVTRVHDIGDVDGLHYISMEFVDGEDLSSLLRRIGRLPRDKAVDVAQQLCAGLAAAHEQGVLHRDLKPANVMLDGRGRVKITDFGLAAPFQAIRGDEARSGTPQYMAPEQWAGGAITQQSDLYSLGLILYELFTGRAAFSGKTPIEIAEQHRDGSTTWTSPSTLVEGFDPTVERLILQCLDQDPAQRPASALALAAALPGGDLLAAALAAGETPSPEMVADLGKKGGLEPRYAWPLFAAVMLLLAGAVYQSGRFQLAGASAMIQPPAVLANEAREILDALGYSDVQGDRQTFFRPDRAYLRHIQQTRSDRDRWDVLRNRQPAAYRYWYRQAPENLVRLDPARIDHERSDPPLTEPGMVELALDTEGRLISFTAVPASVAAPDREQEVDWQSVLTAAGLAPEELDEIEPSWSPPVFASHRRAWKGTFPDAPETVLTVEAAALDGRVVAFRMLGPWSRVSDAAEPGVGRRPRGSQRSFAFVFPAVSLLALLSGAWIAWRNVRRGRGDLKTAWRLALVVLVARLFWLFGARHFATVSELDLLTAHLAQAIYDAGSIWVLYLAAEPFARRLWPRMFTSWVRLFEGRLRDPLVGRDLLVGIGAGLLVLHAQISLGFWARDLVGGAPAVPDSTWWSHVALAGVPQTLAALAAAGSSQLLFMLGIVVLLTISRLVTGRTWIALTVVSAVAILGTYGVGGTRAIPFFLIFPLTLGLNWLVLLRFGILSCLTLHIVRSIVRNLPLSVDPSDWYWSSSAVTLALLVGLAVWGFYRSIDGRLLGDDLLSDSD